MDKLLIVDGSNLLFQMFYGMPARIRNKEGKLIHGTLGFVGALLKMFRLLSPTHVVVLFDGESFNPRTEIDEAYKANRPDYSKMAEEETPFCQLPDIFAALTYLRVPYAETSDCETDDVVAAYALAYGKKLDVVISSFDSDFFQLITPTVKVFRYRGDKSLLCDEEYIQNKFAIRACQYADFKCLVGDTADNIRGVCGIGPKRAALLLQKYEDIQGILENIKEISPLSARENLQNAGDILEKNRRLICLREGAKLPFSIEKLGYRYGGEKTGEVLRAIGVQ